MSHWRKRSRSVILAALKEADAKGLAGKEREKHVSAAYPFGERAIHPYKIWLSEFALLVKGKAKAKKAEAVVWQWNDEKRPTDLPGQGNLFEEATHADD